MIYVFIAITALLLLELGLLIFFWHRRLRHYALPKTASLPFVSVLVAARNEAPGIEACLQSLADLNYPADQYEVWVGNDHSTDDTLHLVQRFISDKPHFHVKDIQENTGQAKGKANVLAQLAREAKGEYLFIADADVTLPKDWLRALLAGFQSGVGSVTGVTGMEGRGWFARCQSLDWLYALGMVKVITDLGRPVTVMGNNMAVSRQAYDSTGGYENIPFSITEDYALFEQLRKQGWHTAHVFQPEALARSRPMRSIGQLLHQRKRWMYGVIQLPWSLKGLLMTQGLFFAAMLAIVYGYPWVALGAWAAKWLLQAVFLQGVLKQVGASRLMRYLPLHEFYSLGLTLLTMLFYILPVKIKWKGRQYG